MSGASALLKALRKQVERMFSRRAPAIDITAEHWDAVLAERERWRALRVSTAAADREATERAISLIYRSVQAEPPEICWFGGPLGCCMDKRITRAEGESCFRSRARLVGQLAGLLSRLSKVLVLKEEDEYEYYSKTRSSDPLWHWHPCRYTTSRLELALFDAVFESLPRDAPGGKLVEQHMGWDWDIPAFVVAREAMGVCYPEPDSTLLDAWTTVMTNTSLWFPLEHRCLCAEPAFEFHVDGGYYLHNADGPSMAFYDGLKLYDWHGVQVPGDWIEHKDRLDPKLAETWMDPGWDELLEWLQRSAIREILAATTS